MSRIHANLRLNYRTFATVNTEQFKDLRGRVEALRRYL